MDIECAREKVRTHSQEQLLRFSEELSVEQLGLLAGDIENVDFEEVEEFWRQQQRSTDGGEVSQPIKMEPVPPEACGSVLRDKAKLKQWEKIGIAFIIGR